MNLYRIVAKYFTLLSITMLCPLFLSGQKQNLEVHGQVVSDMKNVRGVVVRIFENDKKIDSLFTLSDGKFSINLNYNSDFVIEFYKFGYIPKRIVFNTDVPKGFSQTMITDLNLITILAAPQGFVYNKNIEPSAKFKISSKEGKVIDSDNKYTQAQNIKQQNIKDKIEDREKIIKNIQSEIDALSPEAKKTLGVDTKIYEAQKQASNILSEANIALFSARKQADQILNEAKINAQKAYFESLSSLQKNDSSLIPLESIIYSTEVKEDIKALKIDSSSFFKREEIKDKQFKLNELTKLKSKTRQDSLSLLENSLYIKEELLKTAREQLQIDKYKASTKEDSLAIKQREDLILQKEQEIILTRREIDKAKNIIQLQEYEIRNKNNLLIFASFGLVFLIIMVIISLFAYRQKKRHNQELSITNKLLADTNSMLENANNQLADKNSQLADKNIQLADKNNELKTKNHQIMESIHYAKRIQVAILPPEKIFKNYFPEFFLFYEPRDIVSGDFYWFSQVKNKLFIAAVDCTGHGVPGAFMSMIGNTLLNSIIKEQKLESPSLILEELDKRIIQALNQSNESTDFQDDGMDITLCAIDLEKNIVDISCASHLAYLFKGGKIVPIEGDIFSIGGFFSKQRKNLYKSHTFNYDENTTLYLFSDGYPDQIGGPEDRRFRSKNFEKLLISIQGLSMLEQKNIIERTYKEWRGKGPQIDDILVMGINFKKNKL